MLIRCNVTGTTIEDLRQWCSHNLTNQFRVRKPYSHEDNSLLIVLLISDDDRLRLRGAFDIANTSWIVGADHYDMNRY